MCFARLLFLILLLTLSSIVFQVTCLNFGYSFQSFNQTDFILQNSDVAADAILVTPDVGRTDISQNQSGRALYKELFKLWDREEGLRSSFNSSFVFNIQPLTTPGGEGLAFILAENSSLPVNSEGQWLGIVNQTMSGRSRIIAVEFDTRKSFSTDVDDNHVGIDNSSIISINQEPLGVHGIDLSSGADIYASIRYDAKSSSINVYVSINSEASRSERPILTQRFDLSSVLPEDVFIGFSASTGINTQINALKSWNFSSVQIKHQEKDSQNHLLVYILTSLGAAFFFLLLGSLFYLKRIRNRKSDEELEMELEILDSASAPSKFRLRQLASATQNFNIMNKLGQGGFGTVYKGILNNKEIAVKRTSKDGQHSKKDFVAEISTIGNLNHKNLVKLHGWCYEKNELLLVYEFLPNGSLDKLIFSNGQSSMENSTVLSWERRYTILLGVAQALDYLHNGCEKRVLHRDIKPSNIMLDSEFIARLGDFGLARKVQLYDNTHHSTKQFAGTPGYMAPEYLHTRRATVGTDIFAFGITMLQVICGSKLGNEHDSAENRCSIVDWVWGHYRKDKTTDAVDSRLNGEFDGKQATSMLVLGLACCHPNPFERPSTRTVVQVLTGEASAPSVPSEKPDFIWPVKVPCSAQELDNPLSGGQLTLSLVETGR